MLSEERATVEPFTASLLDGIDLRETIRNWHDGKIFVRNLQKIHGEVGSVIVIFDEDRDGRYNYMTTWLGEHQNESDMAFYSTHPFDHLIGPGIGRAEYGGFLMSLPARRMYDVWADPDYDFAETKAERLLLAGMDYSIQKYVVYVAAKPPRSVFRNIAARFGAHHCLHSDRPVFSGDDEEDPRRACARWLRQTRNRQGIHLVKPWNLIDTTLTPDGKTVALYEHDAARTIRVDGADLMSTRRHGSEDRLAELACAHLRSVRRARVLIGGLGFGFTVRAALQALPADATVMVAEILAAVIAWNAPIDDARVTVVNGDVAEMIREPSEGFDSIILDVDNGPVALTTEGNARLYSYEGLRHARAGLRPNGCLAVWSAKPDPKFAKLMRGVGFTVEIQRDRSHTIFLGRRTC